MKRTAERKREGTFSILHSQFSIPRFTGGRRRSGGFTLIEMLVVIVIIVILMGVVFKLSKGALAKSTYAKEVKRVAILRMLIEEFHAEYNLYPPVPEYKIKVNNKVKLIQPVDFTGAFPFDNNPGDLDFYPGNFSLTHATGGDYFAFGLMSLFVDRGSYCNQAFSVVSGRDGNSPIFRDWCGPNKEYNDMPDYDSNGNYVVQVPAKDRAFVKRVTPIVRQIYNGDKHLSVDADTGHTTGFSTLIRDSWGNKYVYISKPPYSTYLIFSPGPDGKYDEDNPGDRSSEDNKDNIYGNLGDK